MSSFEDLLVRELKYGFGTINAEKLVKCAEHEAQSVSQLDLKNHQLRKFYNVIKEIERNTTDLKRTDPIPPQHVARLIFLRPHLKYAADKAHGDEAKALNRLKEILCPCLNAQVLKKKEDLYRFVRFFEGIIAYKN